MWIKLDKINRKTLSGKLANDPVCITNVKCGDTIKFKSEDVSNYLPGKGACK